jgi:hypothetical protein
MISAVPINISIVVDVPPSILHAINKLKHTFI